MKRNYLIGTVAISTALFAVAQTMIIPDRINTTELPEVKAVSIADFPTRPAKSTTELSEGWTVINNNGDIDSYGDPLTWHPLDDVTQIVVGTGHTPKDGGKMDDYLISPAVNLEKGNKYTVSMNYRIGGYYDTDNLAVYVSQSTNPEEIKAQEPVFKIEDGKEEAYTDASFSFTPEESGDYHLIFYCYSDEWRAGVWIAEVKIFGKVASLPVSGLTAYAAIDNSISCTLSWTLPTLDTLGKELTEGAIEKILVYRDDENTPVELPADATSYTDSEEKGLTPGEHTYSVAVVALGVESDKTSVKVLRVGPAQAIDLPADISINSESDFSQWTVIKGEQSTTPKSWRFDSEQNIAIFSLEYCKTDDDWLISPPLKVEEAGYFKVTLSGARTYNGESLFTLMKGESCDITSMEAISPVFNLYSGTATDLSQRDFNIYLESGIHYLALHNQLGKDNPDVRDYTYYIKGLNFEAVAFTPEKVTNLSAKGADDMSLNLIVSWKNPETDIAGISLAGKDYSVKVFINDEETPAAVVTDGSETCTIPVASAGSYKVKVIVENPEGTASSEAVTVQSKWVGYPGVEIPYSIKFTDSSDQTGIIWENFTYDVNNDGETFYLYKGFLRSYFTINDRMDDYGDFILSPYLNLTPGRYKIEYNVNVDFPRAQIPIVVGYIKAGEFDPDTYYLSMETLIEEYINDYGENLLSTTLDIQEESAYQIVFGVVGERTSDSFSFQLNQFSIEEIIPYPANVTDLKVEEDPDDEEVAIISWVNPTTVFGSEQALETLESMVIERNGEIIGTVTEGLVPGEKSSFIDHISSGGKYTYTVYATCNGKGHGGDYAKFTTPWIGGGLQAPVAMDANDDRWGIVDTHNDFMEREYYNVNGWYNYNDLMYYLHDSSSVNPADDYLMTPPVKVKSKELYKITFEAEPNGWADQRNYTASVKMGLGSDHTALPEVATIEIPSDAPINILREYSFHVAVGETTVPTAVKARVESEEPSVGGEDEIYLSAVKIPAGSHTVAIHAATNGGGIRVGSFKFEKVADIDLTTGIEGISTENIYLDHNTLYFPGIADVKVYNVSGVCIISAEQCEDSFTLPELTPGYYIITIADKTFKVILK